MATGALLAFLLLVEGVLAAAPLAPPPPAAPPGASCRVGVACRAEGGRVAGVEGVGVCWRPDRRATSGASTLDVVPPDAAEEVVTI